jgi:hypothetical protein
MKIGGGICAKTTSRRLLRGMESVARCVTAGVARCGGGVAAAAARRQ